MKEVAPLPQAVLDQQKEADEIFAKMYPQEGKETTPEPEKAEAAPEAEKPEESTPAVEDAGTPPAEAAPVQPAKPETPAVDIAEYERLKAAYAALQGKYNAEVPRRAQQEIISALEAKVAALEARNVQAAPQAGTKNAPASDDLKEVYAAMENDFGKDFAANFQRAVRAEAKKIADETLGSVRGEVDGLNKTVAKTREERFISELTRQKPNWRKTYEDPRFVEMLGEVEPLSGKTLGDLAQEASNAGDVDRLARIYDLYDKRTPVSSDAPPARAAEKPNKESLVSPASSHKAQVSGENNKPDYVQAAEIESFYRDVSLGRWADRPKAKAEMDARINRAIANQWVIGG